MENILFIHGVLGSKLQFEPIMEALKGFWCPILPAPLRESEIRLVVACFERFY
jgi:hypothetical protein